MYINKILSVLFLTLMFVANGVQAGGEDNEGVGLVDKLSKGKISIHADVKGCDEDAAQYCPDLPLDSQKGFMCMMAYEHKLSEKCKLGIMEAAMSIRMGAAAINYSVRACEADADKFCLDVQPGEGRMIRCLKEHETEVSEACITSLKETGLWNVDDI